MALSAKMLLRQGQSLVMTPQLLQAIKLLQYSSVELAAFVEEELERNPLLDRVEEGPDLKATGIDAFAEAPGEAATPDRGEPGEGDWSSSELAVSPQGLADSLGTEVENAFDGERDLNPAAEQNQAGGAWTVGHRMVGRGRRRVFRRSAQYRSLYRRAGDSRRPSFRATCGGHRRSGGAHDRHGHHRFHR